MHGTAERSNHMVEAEKGSQGKSVELSLSRIDEAPVGNLDDWISQKALSLEKRLSESDNYLLSFLLDPIQTLAKEGLLEGASEFSMRLTEGSFAKLAWGQNLYHTDPVGVLNLARGNGVGGRLTVRFQGVICVTIPILNRRICIRFDRHI
jgi:hypothetical protein